jgi:stage V sporulation protein SpoVS
MRTLQHLITITAIAFLISACATKKEASYANVSASEVQELSKKLSPEELVERVAGLFDQAQNIDLEFYSPSYYQEAVRAIAIARQGLTTNSSNNNEPAIRAAIAAQEFLEKAQIVRAKVDRNLKDLIKHRHLLIEIGAPTWQAKAYEQVGDEIKELVLLIESDQISAALSKEPGVRSDMYALEINTLLASTLDSARNTLNEAKKAEAQTYAAKLYNEADILIDDTEIYIKGNYRDRKGIQKRADKAQLVADTALKYALDGMQIFALDESQVEGYLASFHDQLKQLSMQISAEGLPPMTLSQSLSTLQLAITNNANIAEEPHADTLATETETSTDNLEVLQVLDSLDLDSPTIPDYEEEQNFDSIEYVE